jgi:hypothetical protein
MSAMQECELEAIYHQQSIETACNLVSGTNLSNAPMAT